MPPQSRSQRKRQATRQQSRPPAPRAVSSPAPISAPSIGETVPLDPATAAPPASAPRAARPSRRVLTRPAPEPVDYTADYDAARTDLRWIAIWTGLMFIAMFALYFSGLV